VGNFHTGLVNAPGPTSPLASDDGPEQQPAGGSHGRGDRGCFRPHSDTGFQFTPMWCNTHEEKTHEHKTCLSTGRKRGWTRVNRSLFRSAWTLMTTLEIVSMTKGLWFLLFVRALLFSRWLFLYFLSAIACGLYSCPHPCRFRFQVRTHLQVGGCWPSQ